MEQAILLLHLCLVIFLIALVLLQRSEGGALGIGGGGGGVVTGRGAASALQKATWYLAAAFLATSLTLTVIAQSERQGASVLDTAPAATEAPATDDGQSALDALVPPTIGDEEPTVPASGTGGSTANPATPASGDGPATPPAE